MKFFISADWGTTHLRLRVVDRDRQQVTHEVRSSDGIATTHEQWREHGQAEDRRLSFYHTVLLRQIRQLQAPPDLSLQDLPVVISGMASSSIGMMELPYQPVPYDAGGSDLLRVALPATDAFPHSILLVSGARTPHDVMRGEEVQLAGCPVSEGEKEGLYLFPGTHSKHVLVKEGKVIDFSTYMTGEFFYLLSARSILAASVAANEADPATAAPVFQQGVKDSRHAPLLHSAFLVRTNQLLGGWTKEDNYHYLSGLVIGEELGYLAGNDTFLTIVCTGRLQENYSMACQVLGIDIDLVDADQALVRGHCRLLDMGYP
jgi:2-dehydro-3-deoxygalactonokinase